MRHSSLLVCSQCGWPPTSWVTQRTMYDETLHHQHLRHTYNPNFIKTDTFLKCALSLPSIYTNYAGAHPFTNGFAFDAFSNHSWKTRQKIPEFSNFQQSVPKFELHAILSSGILSDSAPSFPGTVVPLPSTATLSVHLLISHLVISYLAEWHGHAVHVFKLPLLYNGAHTQQHSLRLYSHGGAVSSSSPWKCRNPYRKKVSARLWNLQKSNSVCRGACVPVLSAWGSQLGCVLQYRVVDTRTSGIKTSVDNSYCLHTYRD